jgi:hypothetical protein
MDRVGTRHSLLLHSVEPSDFAAYTCSATNKIGTATAGLRLSGAPQPPRLAERVDYLGRGSYRLTWSTESYAPIAQYTLLYRKIPVSAWVRLGQVGLSKIEQIYCLVYKIEILRFPHRHLYIILEPDCACVKRRFRIFFFTVHSWLTKQEMDKKWIGPNIQTSGFPVLSYLKNKQSGINCMIFYLLDFILSNIHHIIYLCSSSYKINFQV